MKHSENLRGMAETPESVDKEYLENMANTVELLEVKANKADFALDLIEEWGGIDGSHHKQWLLDELVRELCDDYDEWVKQYSSGEDGPETYDWDEGIAP